MPKSTHCWLVVPGGKAPSCSVSARPQSLRAFPFIHEVMCSSQYTLNPLKKGSEMGIPLLSSGIPLRQALRYSPVVEAVQVHGRRDGYGTPLTGSRKVDDFVVVGHSDLAIPSSEMNKWHNCHMQ